MKKVGKKKTAPDAIDKAEREHKLNNAIKALGDKGDKIIAQTKALEEGLHNINPLMIGHRLLTVRELMQVKIGDKKSAAAKLWKEYLDLRVERLGFKSSTYHRYMDAWTAAVALYPEPFVMEMASRCLGEKVSKNKPFGKYTQWVGQVTKKSSTKEDIKSAAKATQVVEAIVMEFRPPKGQKEKRDYLQAAYNSVMENILRYLKQQEGDAALIDPMHAKDVFLTNLVPYILRGFGCELKFTETVEVRELPKDYEKFAEEENRDRQIKTPPEYIVLEKSGRSGVYHRTNHVYAYFEGTKQECEAKALALNTGKEKKPHFVGVHKEPQSESPIAAG